MIETLETFVANIAKTLEKNGYPANRVALPFEKMYAVAYEKGLNFNKALDLLATQGISHEKTTDKVIFFPKPVEGGKPDFATMAAQAQEMMKNMSPDQLKAMQDMIMNMSDDKKLEMMQQAKAMGLVDEDL